MITSNWKSNHVSAKERCVAVYGLYSIKWIPLLTYLVVLRVDLAWLKKISSHTEENKNWIKKNTHPLFGPFGTRNGATNPITPQIMDITVKGIIMLGVPCILSTILPAFVPEVRIFLQQQSITQNQWIVKLVRWFPVTWWNMSALLINNRVESWIITKLECYTCCYGFL